jgi:hypothetical protein
VISYSDYLGKVFKEEGEGDADEVVSDKALILFLFCLSLKNNYNLKH